MSAKSSAPAAGVGKWSSSTTDPRVRRVGFLLRLNLERALRVPEVASLTGLSVSALSRLFKGRTGTTPARYIKSARMDKAKALLETSFLSVKEITGRVGLADMSHFVRDFEQRYGLSPLRYRRWYWEEADSAGQRRNPPINSRIRQ
jgi:transcriptional regulator GlxA family with amidase domain